MNISDYLPNILQNIEFKPTLNFDLKIGIEILLFSLIVPVIGIFLNSSDIFFLKAAFPWIILPPLMMALRYGTINALISIAVIAFGVLMYDSAMGSYTFPLHFFAGMLILSVISGEIIESWKQKYTQQTHEKQYMAERMGQLDNAYRVLQVSHGQLEDKFVDNVLSLKRSLDQIQTDLDQFSGSPLSLVASKMMKLLEQFEWLEIAGVYAVSPKIGIVERPLAMQGKMPPLMADDDLLTRALRTKHSVSVRKSQYLAKNTEIHSNLLAAIPIVDTQQKVWGVLAIKYMQFTEFHQQNMNMLELLSNYIANLLSGMKVSSSLSHWKQIFTELDSGLKLVAAHNLEAHIASFTFENTEEKEAQYEWIASLSAGLNKHWKIEDSHLRLIVLMPMSNTEENKQYLHNLNKGFEREFGHTMKQAGVRIRIKSFEEYNDPKVLSSLLKKIRQS